jgi:TorA-specific chaperone
MRSALNSDDSAAEVALRLGRAFTQLFEGAGPTAVSLYESGHVGLSGRLFQAPVGRMGQLLRQLDLSINDGFREPPDHLSIELGLLARLMRDDSDPAARWPLLNDHLLAWVPPFADRCNACDRTGFYAGAAQLLTAFLTSRQAYQQYQLSAEPETGVSPCRSD